MMKNRLIIGGKVLLLTIIGLIAMILASIIVPQSGVFKTSLSAFNQYKACLMLLLMHFIVSIVLSYILIKSNKYGIKLFVFLVWITFGLQTFVMQLDTLIFIKTFSALSFFDIGLLVLMSLVYTLLVIPIAMIIYGKWEKNDTVLNNNRYINNYFIKILILAIVFIIIYFTFGFTILFQFSVTKDFYQNTIIQIQNNLILFIIIQFFRGILWVIVGLPLFKLFEKKRDIVIANVLTYSIFSSIGLILPNPLMPAPIRFVHFIEIITSMALFGLITALVINFECKKKTKNTA